MFKEHLVLIAVGLPALIVALALEMRHRRRERARRKEESGQ